MSQKKKKLCHDPAIIIEVYMLFLTFTLINLHIRLEFLMSMQSKRFHYGLCGCVVDMCFVCVHTLLLYMGVEARGHSLPDALYLVFWNGVSP